MSASTAAGMPAGDQHIHLSSTIDRPPENNGCAPIVDAALLAPCTRTTSRIIRRHPQCGVARATNRNVGGPNSRSSPVASTMLRQGIGGLHRGSVGRRGSGRVPAAARRWSATIVSYRAATRSRYGSELANTARCSPADGCPPHRRSCRLHGGSPPRRDGRRRRAAMWRGRVPGPDGRATDRVMS